MQLHPSELTKANSNSNLLAILTKRSAKSLAPCPDWPGKHGPRLANIIIKRNDPRSVKVEPMKYGHSSTNFTRSRRSQ